ncbi:hypothetical protein P7C70_g8990, partial [Phenoliferia sp. Uapishka_3]
MSSATNQTVYLDRKVTGANRGIGFGLVTELVKDSNNLVFAGARDPVKADALNALAKESQNLKVVQVTSGDEADNKAAVEEIRKTSGRLDTVIANADIGKYYGRLVDHPIQEFRDHYEVNTLGVIILFQAVQPLLAKSPTGAGHFAVISTAAASISQYFPLSASAYGSSKASANFIVKVIHSEHEADGIVASAHQPGWVQTDMGNGGAVANGMAAAPVKLEDCVKGLLGNIVGATRESAGGKFLNAVRAKENPWDIETAEIAW